MVSNWCAIKMPEGLVVNIFLWDGIQEIGVIEDCIYVQSDVAGPGWTYVDGEFIPPPATPPDPAVILAAARAQRDYLIRYATLRIDPLQDAVDLEEDDADPALLLAWKKYRSALGKVENKPGWPDNPDWPVPPVPLESVTSEPLEEEM
jgi:hypothetical protein